MIPHVSPFCQSPISFAVDLWYNGYAVNFSDSLFYAEGGELPLSVYDIVISFFVSVAAGIATYYICKGLDVVVRRVCKWLDRYR